MNQTNIWHKFQVNVVVVDIQNGVSLTVAHNKGSCKPYILATCAGSSKFLEPFEMKIFDSDLMSDGLSAYNLEF